MNIGKCSVCRHKRQLGIDDRCPECANPRKKEFCDNCGEELNEAEINFKEPGLKEEQIKNRLCFPCMKGNR